MSNWYVTDRHRERVTEVTPLAELAAALAEVDARRARGTEARGAIPLPWVVAHGGPGQLEAIWHAAREPIAMVRVAAPFVRPGLATRATCACVRVALAEVPAMRAVGERVLAAAEAYADGLASEAELQRARGELARAADSFTRSEHWQSVEMLRRALDAAPEPGNAPFCVRAIAAAAAPASEFTLPLPGEETFREARLAAFSDAVRTWLPCPTLDALVAYARGRP